MCNFKLIFFTVIQCPVCAYAFNWLHVLPNKAGAGPVIKPSSRYILKN